MPSRYCRACSGWHDLDQDWPQGCYGHFKAVRTASLQIIKDIEPYQAVATDVATGKPPRIKSRSQHREFLRRNNYVEVGNEPMRERPTIDVPDSHRDIKRTIDQFRSEGRWK